MGCKVSRLKEDAVIAIPFKSAPQLRGTDENLNLNSEEPSEFSLRECSLIPSYTDLQKRRASDSIFGILQEIS